MSKINTSVFAKIASRGPQIFSAPPPEEAFEVWWRKEFGTRMKESKSIAKKSMVRRPARDGL